MVSDISALGGVDAVLITNYSNPQKTYNDARRAHPQNNVLTLPILNISRQGMAGIVQNEEAGLQ